MKPGVASLHGCVARVSVEALQINIRTGFKGQHKRSAIIRGNYQSPVYNHSYNYLTVGARY